MENIVRMVMKSAIKNARLGHIDEAADCLSRVATTINDTKDTDKKKSIEDIFDAGLLIIENKKRILEKIKEIRGIN